MFVTVGGEDSCEANAGTASFGSVMVANSGLDEALLDLRLGLVPAHDHPRSRADRGGPHRPRRHAVPPAELAGGSLGRRGAPVAAASGVDGTMFLRTLEQIAAEGSDRGRIIDRALVAVGADHVPVGPLVEAFRAHDPGSLAPYPGVPALLDRLRAVVRIGLVSDGDVHIQRGKLRAIGLQGAFDVVVWSRPRAGQVLCRETSRTVVARHRGQG